MAKKATNTLPLTSETSTTSNLLTKPLRVLRSKLGLAPSGTNKSLRVSIEKPLSIQTISDDIEVRGWIFTGDGRGVSGELIINGKRRPLAIDRSRDDVSRAYGLRLNSKIGFEAHIGWDELGTGISEVSLEIALYVGNELLAFGPYQIVKTTAPVLRHHRGSYKEVWNDAADDSVSAMLAVAGIGDFEAFMQSGESTATTIRKTLGISKNDTVLEIGCGTGRIGNHLAPLCKTWIGTDISGKMLEYAEKNLEAHKNIKLVELKSVSLSQFPAESVDKLYCSTVFMHLDEWDRYRYVTESFRTLRRGGRFYVDNINLAGEEGWAIFQEASRLGSTERPAAISKPSTAEELTTYLARAGFVDIEFRREGLYVTVWGTKP